MADAGESRQTRVVLDRVSARREAARGAVAASLVDVSLEHGLGVLGIWGAAQDGTALLLDVVAGSARHRSGGRLVEGSSPSRGRASVWRIDMDAPLPETLWVHEVCMLSASFRGEPEASPDERLRPFGLARYAGQRVRTLARTERRALMLALALSSPSSDVLLIDEPLLEIDPLAPAVLIDALRAKSRSCAVLVSSASARALHPLADRLGALSKGRFALLPPGTGVESLAAALPAVVRVVLTPPHGKLEASELAAILAADPWVTRVETDAGRGATASVLVSGDERRGLSHSITRAIAQARIDVELIEVVRPVMDAACREIVVAHAAATLSGRVGQSP